MIIDLIDESINEMCSLHLNIDLIRIFLKTMTTECYKFREHTSNSLNISTETQLNFLETCLQHLAAGHMPRCPCSIKKKKKKTKTEQLPCVIYFKLNFPWHFKLHKLHQMMHKHLGHAQIRSSGQKTKIALRPKFKILPDL